MKNSKALLSLISLSILLTACGTSAPQAENKTTNTTTTPATSTITTSPSTPAEVKALSLNKSTFVRGEKITASFELKQGTVEENGWIGVVPANIPSGKEIDAEGKYITYEYLKGMTAGSKFLSAPNIPGEYSVRIYSSDSEGIELARADFKVSEPTENEATVKVDKSTYAPGEEIIATFTAPLYPDSAWLGLIPSEVEHGSESTNDANDLAYQYLEGKTSGTLNFTAPEKPGKYDLRLNTADSFNGVEITYTTFEVK